MTSVFDSESYTDQCHLDRGVRIALDLRALSQLFTVFLPVHSFTLVIILAVLEIFEILLFMIIANTCDTAQ